MYFDREKHYIQDYTVSILVNIIECIDRRFGKLDEGSNNVTAEAKEGDTILFIFAACLTRRFSQHKLIWIVCLCRLNL